MIAEVIERLSSVKDLEDLRSQLSVAGNAEKTFIAVCGGTGCRASGSSLLADELSKELAANGLDSEYEVRLTGCLGFCEHGPLVIVNPDQTFYQLVEQSDISQIVKDTLMNGHMVERLLYKEPKTQELVAKEHDINFYKKQQRVVLKMNGIVDPTKIEHYIQNGGYRAVSKILGLMSPEDVIEEVEKSGLRGRGGAGFPTGTKWKYCRSYDSDKKYLICNADEGDPGAFMDRSVLEGNPQSVIEGMIIAAYAVGADEGFVYVRAEYPLAIKHLELALKQAEQLGLLGENILGSEFSFKIKIKQGVGAFVCGEETALMASIEGYRGMPRLRPPYPAESGLWGKPTVINNVESLSNIAHIINNGWQWYSSMGTEKSKGTKIFSLAGKVNNTGLIEVPFGISLKEIINDIGGGISGGKKFKAVQMGGPSGGCIPATDLNISMDYESLTAAGAMVGSGGIIVMDESTCMVDIARFFLSFTQDESCGKCAPCRIGTKRMLEILTKITRGNGKLEDIALLKELAEAVKKTSLCGLGQTAPNPVLSTLKYFENEYIAHIEEKRCPACICESMFKAPCNHACPAQVDVTGYVSLIGHGKVYEAMQVHLERNPFPSVCAYVCPHPCEPRCRRGDLDKPIAIKDLKRFMVENAGDAKVGEQMPDSGFKIAIVGGGAAGLTAAYHLKLSGHEVKIIEALDKVGGQMFGIQDVRLPKESVKRDIERILDLGVELELNKALGRDFSIDDLKARGYNAVFIAIGAKRPVKFMPLDEQGNSLGLIDIPGIDRDDKQKLIVNKDLSTNIEGVFAGGDSVLGPSKVVDCVGQGQLAAFSIDAYLRGESPRLKLLQNRESDRFVEVLPEDVSDRQEPPQIIDASTGLKSTGILGLEQAIQESKRCLRCELQK